jgi:transcription antitermination factor NusG
MGSAWFVIVTKEGGTRVAVEDLIEKRVPIYIPLVWKQVREGRAFRAKDEPRYPGYIFAMFDLVAEEDGPVRRCAGVEGILPLGQRPVPVRLEGTGADGKPIDKDGAQWVASMRAHELAQWIAAQAKPVPRKDIVRGDQVIIDKAAAAYGVRGEVMDLRKYQAKVLIGLRMCWIDLIYLKKPDEEAQGGKAA